MPNQLLDNQLPENPFPPEHAHVDEWIREAEAELQTLDQEMNRPAQAPRVNLDPPRYSSQPPSSFRRSRSDIQQEKDTLKADVYQRVEKETDNAPKETQQASRDIAFGRLYQEDIAKLAASPTNQLPQPSAHWNMNDVQVKIMAHAKNARDQQRQAKQPARSEPAEQTMSKPEWSVAELSAETSSFLPNATDITSPDWEPER